MRERTQPIPVCINNGLLEDIGTGGKIFFLSAQKAKEWKQKIAYYGIIASEKVLDDCGGDYRFMEFPKQKLFTVTREKMKREKECRECKASFKISEPKNILSDHRPNEIQRKTGMNKENRGWTSQKLLSISKRHSFV